MHLSGRPESGWTAIGSHVAQRAPGLMCGALLNGILADVEIWQTLKSGRREKLADVRIADSPCV